MRNRCYKENNQDYKNYGGRGIYVCDEWQDFATFRRDMLEIGYDYNKPSNAQTMDRIDNDGPYAPWNIRLADAKTQANNRRKYKRPGHPKRVAAIDDDENIVREFNSIKEAAEWCNCKSAASNIPSAAAGRRNSVCGYRWRYINGEAKTT